MNPYQTHAIEGASGVELTVALYDGIIGFMQDAISAVERGDERRRRLMVKRAMDIVIHLQATLKMDIGGEPAKALAEFYVAMFALMLQGSQANAPEKFEQVIACVRNVRGAWRQVVNHPEVNPVPSQMSSLPPRRMLSGFDDSDNGMDSTVGSSWSV